MNFANCSHDLPTYSGGSSVQQGIDGLPRKARAHINDHARHCECSDRIGYPQRGDANSMAQPDQSEANDDYATRPDVGCEVQRVGFERLAVVAQCCFAQRSGAPEIHAHREEKHSKGGDGWFDRNMMEKKSAHRLADDPYAGDKQQASLDESRKVLDFSVAVLMACVRGLVRYTHREECNDGRDQIEARMSGFRNKSETSCGDSHEDLESGDSDGSNDRI